MHNNAFINLENESQSFRTRPYPSKSRSSALSRIKIPDVSIPEAEPRNQSSPRNPASKLSVTDDAASHRSAPLHPGEMQTERSPSHSFHFVVTFDGVDLFIFFSVSSSPAFLLGHSWIKTTVCSDAPMPPTANIFHLHHSQVPRRFIRSF